MALLVHKTQLVLLEDSVGLEGVSNFEKAVVKRHDEVKGADPRWPDVTVSVLRSKIEQVHGPVLELARTCGFCPQPDHSTDAELAGAGAGVGRGQG